MAVPYRSGQALGWLEVIPVQTTTVQLSASTTWFAVAFTPDSGRTLNAIRQYISAIAGALASTDITCDLYDSTGTGGIPGATIETGKLPTATITAAGWYDFTGFSTVLTANTQYWLVFKNVTAVAATNNCTFRLVNSVRLPWSTGDGSRLMWGAASSVNSGTSWTQTPGRLATRIAYADGYDGIPVSNAVAAAVGDGVYATRESGVKFTSPLNSVLRVVGAAFYIGGLTASPANGFRFGLWAGSTPVNLAYTQTIPKAAILTTPAWFYSYFSATQVIPPASILRVTLATTGADTSGNRYNNWEVSWDTDANSVILLPWNGTCAKTYFDASSWTDSPLGTSVFPHALLLDTAQELGFGYRRSEIIQGHGTY